MHLAEEAANLMWYHSEARLLVIIRSYTSFSSYPIAVLPKINVIIDPCLCLASLSTEKQICPGSYKLEQALIIYPLAINKCYL